MTRQVPQYSTLLLILLGLLLPHLGWAQVRQLLSGTVRALDGTALPGATVAVPALGLGTTTDGAGYYQLELPGGPEQVTASFIDWPGRPVQFGARPLSGSGLVLPALRRK